MSTPERTFPSGNGNATPRLPDGPIAPPQNLEAEQSVLGAVLLSDTALPALIIDERLHPEDFYREAHGIVFAAMLELHNGGEPVDALTLVEHLKQAGQLEAAGGRATIDLLSASVPAVGHLRQYARIVRENAMLRRLLRAAYDIQARVHSHDAPPRELVDIAERTILEVAHEDSRKDFRAVNDVLFAEIDKLEKLSQEGKAITGTPSGFDDLDTITGGFQPGNLIVLAARPSMGKCLAGSTLVYDPRSGSRRRIDDLVAAFERGEDVEVVSLNSRLELHPSSVSDAMRSGKQPVYRLATRLGRQLDATAGHPLLTMRGWRKLEELRPADRIAVPRNLPWPYPRRTLPDHEIVLLAALIADGNLTQKTPRFAFGQDSPVATTVAEAAAAIGVRLNVPAAGHGTATLSNGGGSAHNPVTELFKKHALWGKGSRDKFLPDAIFGLDPDQIGRFLSVLYACDGHVHVTERLAQIGYTTISEQLAQDVQHLLLRLGCVAKIRPLNRAVYEGTGIVAREVLVTGQADLDAFVRNVRIVGKEARLERVFARLGERRYKTCVDTLPVEIWHRVNAARGEQTWATVSAACGRSRSHNWHVGTRGLSRPQLAILAGALHHDELGDLAAADIWWDAVASITPLGEQETYDLTVPGDHNFVANDLVVHNSALMANFAENAALGTNKAVALFSLEMSESELAQRFIASQASIKGDDLRKGRVPAARWGKIMEASNRLAKSPLFIDDSSDLSVLDVRAKARRLLQQQADGLGLILIDYLQLMRADGRTDNRVEQIGQISRGLKTLARELECPVVALSQLNRGVEQRTDKRPVLSDLRESGCLTGESRVYLPDAGVYKRIDELVGGHGFRVLALNRETWKLEPCRVTNAFSTGRKPVYALSTRLGRRVCATANHRFLTVDGWLRLDELEPDTFVALPRRLSGPSTITMSDAELGLLGHLIGDGCTLPRHAIQYTTKESELAELVAALATETFGDRIRPTITAERTWQQVYLAAADRLGRGRRNPVAAWLDELGVFGLRSSEKRVPQKVFEQPFTCVARFLRHLWATDGCLWFKNGRAAIYYATSSARLARDVQSLLLRIGVNAGVSRVRQAASERDQFHVHVTGAPDSRRFLAVVGAVGERRLAVAAELQRHFRAVTAVTNRDVVPRRVWQSTVAPAMAATGVTTRALQQQLDMSYCGSTLYRSDLGRERAARVAEIVASAELALLAESDVHWDRIVAIEPAGDEEVFDLTVDRLHNFVAEDVLVHNSIEQDADLVMFIYRDEYYDKESEKEGIADLIISKHRNGGLGTVELTFQKEYPRFMSYVGDDRY